MLVVVDDQAILRAQLDRDDRALRGLLADREAALAALGEAVSGAGFTIERAELVPGLLPIGFVAARREG